MMADQTREDDSESPDNRRSSFRGGTSGSVSEQLLPDNVNEPIARPEAIRASDKQWRVGDIVEIPRLVSSEEGDESTDESFIYRVGSKTRWKVTLCPAIIFAVYSTRVLVLPVLHGWPSSERTSQLMALSVVDSDAEDESNAVRNLRLVVKDADADSWHPEAGSYVNINQSIAVEYDWLPSVKNVLDNKSIKLLNQITRFVYGMMMHMDIEEQGQELKRSVRGPYESEQSISSKDDGLASEIEEPKDQSSSVNIKDLSPHDRPGKHPVFATQILKKTPTIPFKTKKHSLGPGDRLPNGNYVCGHYNCNKNICTHHCCHEGSKKKPSKAIISKAIAHLANNATDSKTSPSRVSTKGAVKKPGTRGVTIKVWNEAGRKRAAIAETHLEDEYGETQAEDLEMSDIDDDNPQVNKTSKQAFKERGSNSPTKSQFDGSQDTDVEISDTGEGIPSLIDVGAGNARLSQKTRLKPRSLSKPSSSAGISKSSRVSPGPLIFKEYNIHPDPVQKGPKAKPIKKDPLSTARTSKATPARRNSGVQKPRRQSTAKSRSRAVLPAIATAVTASSIIATTSRSSSAEALSPVSRLLISERIDPSETQQQQQQEQEQERNVDHVSLDQHTNLETMPEERVGEQLTKLQDIETAAQAFEQAQRVVPEDGYEAEAILQRTTRSSSATDAFIPQQPIKFTPSSVLAHVLAPTTQQMSPPPAIASTNQVQAQIQARPQAEANATKARAAAAAAAEEEEALTWLAAEAAGFGPRRSPPLSPSPSRLSDPEAHAVGLEEQMYGEEYVETEGRRRSSTEESGEMGHKGEGYEYEYGY